jgi:hypothetical protein
MRKRAPEEIAGERGGVVHFLDRQRHGGEPGTTL